jgi:hypothetical protein
MANTTITDYVIWAKHIHDDPLLTARVVGMRAGETVELEIEGERGAWRKMEDGKDGRATPGLRPVGAAQDHWRSLYKSRRGQVARVDVVRERQGVAERGAAFQTAAAEFLRADAERQAALAALLDGARQGCRSEGRTLARDEMHDR